MTPTSILRLEGVGAFVAAVGGYILLDGPLWLFAILILAPDVGMLGYVAGARVGSVTYNVLHTYVGPLLLAAVGYWMAAELVTLAALVWAAHIGADRALGYGLKHATAFGDTHLGRVGRERGGGAVRRQGA